MRKAYLGDSVYVEYDGWGLILTTENGLPADPSNTIHLEPEVVDSLLDYVAGIRKDFAAGMRDRVKKVGDK